MCCNFLRCNKKEENANIVYFELLRRGYDVAIGKIDKKKVDFIATRADDKKYIQVTEAMNVPETRERELSPLQRIPDNYEKLVVCMDTGLQAEKQRYGCEYGHEAVSLETASFCLYCRRRNVIKT